MINDMFRVVHCPALIIASLSRIVNMIEVTVLIKNEMTACDNLLLHTQSPSRVIEKEMSKPTFLILGVPSGLPNLDVKVYNVSRDGFSTRPHWFRGALPSQTF